MQPRRVLSAVGDITRIFSFTLAVPFLFAWLYDPRDTLILGRLAVPRHALTFLATFLAATLFWVPVKLLTRDTEDEEMQDREAYLTVGVGWLVLTVIAAIPFWLSGVLPHPADAFFEAMSGLTTTGATVIPGALEEVPKSIMLWRAQLQYLGGMGIIVLSVALLARLTQGGLQLLQAEAPGPSVTRIRPKLAQTAKTLWLVYAAASLVLALLILALLLGRGVGTADALYDAVLHTFTTLSTGGFSNHSTSIAAFDSWLFEAVIILGMLVAGSNFTLLYYLGHRQWRRLVRDPEWRFFMATVAGVTLVATGLLWRAAGWAWDEALPALRGASFTVTSIATSTGFSTVDFDAWPDAAKTLLLILMLTGATAGSTSGGLKAVRILLLMKIVRRQVRRLLHPRAVIPIRLGGRVLKEETLMTVVAFFFAYLTIAMVGAIFVTATDPVLDLISGTTGAISMMGNTGPALGVLGPTGGYWDLLWSSKLVYAFMMWFGRLEVFAALLLFSPSAWKN